MTYELFERQGMTYELFERQGMTYELLPENFSMEKLNSLLYCNCSVNFYAHFMDEGLKIMSIKSLYLKVETRLLFAPPMKISGYTPVNNLSEPEITLLKHQ